MNKASEAEKVAHDDVRGADMVGDILAGGFAGFLAEVSVGEQARGYGLEFGARMDAEAAAEFAQVGRFLEFVVVRSVDYRDGECSSLVDVVEPGSEAAADVGDVGVGVYRAEDAEAVYYQDRRP